MPVYSRRQLRERLGVAHLGDTYVGSTTLSWGYAAYSLNIVDVAVADLALSGQGAHAGAYLAVRVNDAGYGEVRVASFNTGSGAYLSQGIIAPFGVVVPSGTAYERAAAVPARAKDRALDEAIRRLRVRREVGVPGVAGAVAYPVPAGVEQVLDAHAFADPAAAGDRGYAAFGTLAVVETATGPEVRLAPAIGGSAQLLLDAITTVTLGAADDATVNVPDERLVLFAAEAVCWDLLVRAAPRGAAGEYRALRDEASRQYAALARNFKVPVDRPLRIA